MNAKRNRRDETPAEASQAESAAVYALQHLQTALAMAKEAGAPKLSARIRLAISSAKGAVRNAGYRVTRARASESK